MKILSLAVLFLASAMMFLKSNQKQKVMVYVRKNDGSVEAVEILK